MQEDTGRPPQISLLIRSLGDEGVVWDELLPQSVCGNFDSDGGGKLLVLLLLLGLLGVAGHGWGLLGECLGFFHQDRPLFGDREFAVEGWGAFAGFDADGYA